MVTKTKVVRISGNNRGGGKATKVHTSTSYFSFSALTTPVNAPAQRKSWLCLWIHASGNVSYFLFLWLTLSVVYMK